MGGKVIASFLRSLVLFSLITSILAPVGTVAAPRAFDPNSPALGPVLDEAETQTAEASITPTEEPTITLTSSATETLEPTITLTPSETGTAEATATHTSTNTDTPTSSSTFTPSETLTPSVTPTPDTFVLGDWTPLASLNGDVYATLWVNGVLYAGGNFTDAGGNTSVDYLAKFSSGSWVSPGGQFNGPVRALAASSSIIYAGGDFTMVGSLTVNRIAKFQSGSWSALGGGLAGNVKALAVSHGVVYAGGQFEDPSGTADFIAKFSNNAWSSVGGGLPTVVEDIVIDGDVVYASGFFLDAGGDPNADRVAKFSNGVWSALGSSPPPLGVTYTLALYNGVLYAGGGGSGNKVAKFESSTWTSFPSLNSEVYDVLIWGDVIFAAGAFTDAGDSSGDYISYYANGAWSSLGSPSSSLNNFVNDLSVNGTTLYAGGKFTNAAGDSQASRIAKILIDLAPIPVPTASTTPSPTNSATATTTRTPTSTSTTIPPIPGIWSALGGANSGLNGQVFSILVDGGTVYAGGSFTSAGGVTAASNLAKFSGGAWSAVGSGANFSANVYALSINGGDLYIGGSFLNAGNANSDRIVKFSGGVLSPLASGLPSGRVEAIEVDSGIVYAGGTFTDVNGNVDLDYIAMFNGSAWEPVAAQVLNGAVRDIVIASGTIYAVGDFTNVGGNQDADYVVKLSGGDWVPLAASLLALNNPVNAIAIEGGQILVGGNFTNAGGISTADYFAKFNGTTWSSAGTMLEALNGPVEDIEVYGGVIYVSGHFINPGGNQYGDFIARYSGYNWVTVNTDNNWINAIVYDIEIDSGVLYAGGNFNDGGGNLNADKIAKIGVVAFPTATPTLTPSITPTNTLTPTLPAAGNVSVPIGSTTHRTPNYTWAEVPTASQYRYQVYKGAALLFTKTVTAPSCSNSRCNDTASNSLPNGEYKWHVQAMINGVFQAYTEFQTFYVVPNAFHSSFGNDAAGWTPMPVGGSWALSDGYYRSLGSTSADTTVYHFDEFTALTYEVKLERESSDPYWGINWLYFRGKPNLGSQYGYWTDGYQLAWDNERNFWLGFSKNNVFYELIDWSYAPSIFSPDANTIRISMSGTSMLIEVNGKVLVYGSQAALTTGQVGIGFYRHPSTSNDILNVDWATVRPSARLGAVGAAELQGAINLDGIIPVEVISPMEAKPIEAETGAQATSTNEMEHATGTLSAQSDTPVVVATASQTATPISLAATLAASLTPTNTATNAQLALADQHAPSSKRMVQPHASYPKP